MKMIIILSLRPFLFPPSQIQFLIFDHQTSRSDSVSESPRTRVSIFSHEDDTLGEFGSSQFVVDKLIQAEKPETGHGRLQVYEFEYIVDSTRGGMKGIISAAFVTSKKLYLLNIAHLDKPENPLDTQTRMMLKEALHSFDAVLDT
ncbi:hypothetical protein ACJRO7_033613 [Eucalyptus globulus]|uniref:PsbP C-terminal domain-containing protein n=1 Tax=Eucalyptus globulus TaxID=34317 RepID=A0ABD3JQY1_EUCGL